MPTLPAIRPDLIQTYLSEPLRDKERKKESKKEKERKKRPNLIELIPAKLD